MIIDRHALALVSITGSCLDVLGAMYLAYDLLGGQHGPLRTLTRGVTYGVLFGAGYGLALGPAFGLASGVAHGITLGWEYSRASKNEPAEAWWRDATASAIRGLGFAIGVSFRFGGIFGIVFGILSTVGQIFAYRLGIRPTLDYKPATRPRLTKRQFWAAVNRMIGYTLTGYVSAVIAHRRAEAAAVGFTVGLAIGAVTVIVGTCTPFIEWEADHIAERRMGVLGIGLMLIGFAMQSAQYWVTLADIPVR
jgi:hypothetical protein